MRQFHFMAMSASLASLFNRFKADRKAVTAIEYALIAALIAVVIIGGVSAIGKNASATFNKISLEL